MFAKSVLPLVGEVLAVRREIAASRSLRTAALVLGPYAGLLVGLDVAGHYGDLTNAPLPRQFFLSSDSSFGEWLEYALTASVAAMLFIMWRREGSGLYLANAILFVWLTLFALALRGARLRPAAYSLILAACIAATAFFGIVVDMLVVWGDHSPLRLEIEVFIEDGGEFAMICIAFMLAVAMFDIEKARLAGAVPRPSPDGVTSAPASARPAPR